MSWPGPALRHASRRRIRRCSDYRFQLRLPHRQGEDRDHDAAELGSLVLWVGESIRRRRIDTVRESRTSFQSRKNDVDRLPIASRVKPHGPLWWGVALLGLLSGCRMSATGHNVEGVRYFQQGQHQAAVAKFQQALASNPSNADSYYNLAATLHEWGRTTNNSALLEQAEGMYHQCLDLNPDHVECYRALAVLLVDTRRPESAFTLLERWAARTPQTSDARIELARLYEEFGDESTARRHLADALNVNARDARAWTAMARLREKEGRLAQALTDYQYAYNLNSRQPGLAQRITDLQRRVAQVPPNNWSGPEPRTVANPSQWVPR